MKNSQGVLRGWAERQGFPRRRVQQGGPDMFAQMLESSAPPKMAIIDIDGQADPLASTARLVSLCGPDCRLVIIGSANDVGLYRRIMGAGAVDYLVKPLAADTSQSGAQRRPQQGDGKRSTREARIVVVIGVRGGVGASTVGAQYRLADGA